MMHEWALRFCSLLVLMLSATRCSAQVDSSSSNTKNWFDTKDRFHTNRIYFYWGYNRSIYSKTDIHFHGPGYDFTVYDATGMTGHRRSAQPII